MRAFERREAGITNTAFFKLATWDSASFNWKAGKKAVPTEAAARALAKGPGRYRVERFDGRGFTCLEPFEV
jgi:hypothetical protein